jgi:hypothetical protein
MAPQRPRHLGREAKHQPPGRPEVVEEADTHVDYVVSTATHCQPKFEPQIYRRGLVGPFAHTVKLEFCFPNVRRDQDGQMRFVAGDGLASHTGALRVEQRR